MVGATSNMTSANGSAGMPGMTVVKQAKVEVEGAKNVAKEVSA